MWTSTLSKAGSACSTWTRVWIERSSCAAAGCTATGPTTDATMVATSRTTIPTCLPTLTLRIVVCMLPSPPRRGWGQSLVGSDRPQPSDRRVVVCGALLFSTRSLPESNGEPPLVRRLVDTDRGRQDQDIVLSGGNLDAIGVAHAEPLLRDRGHIADAVFVVQDVALNLEVRTIADLDGEALPKRGDHRLVHHRHALAAGPLDLHRVADAGDSFLDRADLVALHVAKDQGVPHPQGLAIDFEGALTMVVLDEEVITDRD